MKKILVFGVFDGLHSGHIYFLKQARKLGDKLIVAIAPDKIVKKLKHKIPHTNQKERLELVQSLKIVNQAMIGDRRISSYEVVKRLNPDIICLGYDQQALAQDIKKHLPNMKVMIARAYKSRRMHTSKLIRQ